MRELFRLEVRQWRMPVVEVVFAPFVLSIRRLNGAIPLVKAIQRAVVGELGTLE